MEIGFNDEWYVEKQTEKILERINRFNNKLYLEFGGKLFDDLHASRVLPGFDPNVKTKLLQKLKDHLEIIFCISAPDIERNKIRADLGIPYSDELLRLIDNLRGLGIYVSSIVITQFSDQPQAIVFQKKLQIRGERVYTHRLTKGYPNDVDTIVSDEGYGANPYIETTRPLVVVNGPGPGSGKLATCLSQLFHEYKRGVNAGYAKFETFPVWNLPLNHPVNIAYEAATVDIRDFNMIDSFHLDAYGVSAVNYNRDLEVFPVVRNILTKITGNPDLYRSPTDLGVNMIGYAISDDEACREAAKQEIIRRYYKVACDYKQGLCDIDTVHRAELLVKNVGCVKEDRKVVLPAIEKSKASQCPAIAMQIDDKIITSRDTDIMCATANMIINALKNRANINDRIKLISPVILEPILKLKRDTFHANGNTILDAEECLLALSVAAATNPTVEYAMSKLPLLKGCEAHSTVMLPERDLFVLRKLGINMTCEPEFKSKLLFQK